MLQTGKQTAFVQATDAPLRWPVDWIQSPQRPGGKRVVQTVHSSKECHSMASLGAAQYQHRKY